MGRQPPDAILFDLDGVIVDSRTAITRSINHALAAHGLSPRAEEELHRYIGPPLAVAFAELTGQPADSAAVIACVGTYRERYVDASLRETEVVPGITEVLVELIQHHRLAVATSKPLAFTEPLLAALALRDFFDVVAGPDLTAHSEDKSETIGGALSALDADRAVMVGDRSYDIIGAHTHGLAAVGVAWGIGSVTELTSAGADAIVTDPAELPAVTGRLLLLAPRSDASRRVGSGR